MLKKVLKHWYVGKNLYICVVLGCFGGIRGRSQNHKTAENQSDMMETSRYGTGVGRGTMVCGDPKTWFPMRVTYSREMQVKRELDRLEIENIGIGKDEAM